MNISILSLFPELYQPFFATSLLGRACQSGKITPYIKNLFDGVEPKKRIDAPVVGPGRGMMIKPDVLASAIDGQQECLGSAYKIFFSPQGRKLTQPVFRELADIFQKHEHVMLVTSRYEGIDARVEQAYADDTISLGDFVLLGGDIPAMALLEGVLRLIPGIVGSQESVDRESFEGSFVDYPQYTLPTEWRGMKIPEVLLSGNHGAIDSWRTDQAARKTVEGHFEWLRSWALSKNQKEIAKKHIPSHYAVLMHDQVLLKDGSSGTTSVTTMDIHDISRSGRTYDIKNYFLVTPLVDQQNIVKTLLDFWVKGEGFEYNRHRYDAVSRVRLMGAFDDVCREIARQEGSEPYVIATSAKEQGELEKITFFDQKKVWAHKRPVLFVFGTGHGLAPEVLAKCHAVLPPVEGFTDFNHLSVRTAAGIIFDRWLGINPRYAFRQDEK
jgi:tRNA (guanine37-N1)-methyltransferase